MSLTRRFRDALRSSRERSATERSSSVRGREERGERGSEPLAQNQLDQPNLPAPHLPGPQLSGVDARRSCSLIPINGQGSYSPPDGRTGSSVTLIVIPGLCHQTLSNDIPWIRDSWLYSAFTGDSRVFYFDYPREICARYHTGQVDRCAQELLSLAAAIHGPVSHPVLLLCYGLGGILGKKAFCLGQTTGAKGRQCIRGIIFLGTPHASSAMCDFPTILCNIVSTIFEGEVKADLQAGMKKNAFDLSLLSEEFAHRSSTLHVSSFYEERPTTPVDNIIIDQAAATISRFAEQAIALPVDHHEMCRTPAWRSEVRDLVGKVIQHTIWELLEPAGSVCLARPAGTNFTNASSSIALQGTINVQNQGNKSHRRSSTSTPENGSEYSLSEEEQKCLDHFLPASAHDNGRFHATSVFGRESHIAEHTSGTLGWIEKDPAYGNWRAANSSQILLVSGYAGCGKSVLSFYVKESTPKSSNHESLTCRYFFDGTTKEQSSVCSLLRSLVYQLVSRRHRLARIVKKEFKADPAMLSDSRRLWLLFSKLATHKRTPTLWLIIDALDECDHEDQQVLIRNLAALTSVDDTAAGVKVFVTCRTHSAAVSAFPTDLRSATRLALENKAASIRNDVETYIEEHVRNLVNDQRCPKSKKEVLETALKKRSEATFLWVSLTLSILHQRRLSANDDIDQIVNSIPSGLTHIYDNILNAIPKPDFDTADKVLRTIAASNRRLSLGELNAIVAIRDEHQSLAELRENICLPDEDFVEKLLMGLVNVQDRQFLLVHHTLKEFILERDKHTAECHAIIAHATTRYLLLEDFRFDLFQDPSPQTPYSTEHASLTQEITEGDEAGGVLGDLFKEPSEISMDMLMAVANRFELFDYAARFWHMHFAECQKSSLAALQESVLDLYSKDNQENWYYYLCHVSSSGSDLPSRPDSLTLACLFGHAVSIKPLILGRDEISCGDAIYWAAKNGHGEALETLLPVASRSVQSTQYRVKSPLAAASEHGHLQCVQCLLASDLFQVNDQDEGSRNALSLAAAHGHVHVMTAILARDETNPNVADRMGRTALIEAVRSESVPAVRKLLSDRRTNAGHLDNKNRSALSWACEYGLVETVRVLLLRHRDGKREQSDSLQKALIYGSGGNESDLEGWTTLMHAVASSNFDLVKLLLHKGNVNISDKDSNGRNAISHAAQRSNTAILKHLVGKDSSCANAQDADGWSPFAWTLDPPERVENARVLLPFHRLGLDDRTGLAMFVLAVKWGATRIASLLVEEGTFAVNTTSVEGRTALSFVAEQGNDVLVWQLLHLEGVDADLADESGLTPASWARAAGHADILRLLSKYSARG